MELKTGSFVAIKRLSPNSTGIVIGYDIGYVQEIEDINGELRYRVAIDGIEVGRVFANQIDEDATIRLGSMPLEKIQEQPCDPNPNPSVNVEENGNNEEIGTPPEGTGVQPILNEDPSPSIDQENIDPSKKKEELSEESSEESLNQPNSDIDPSQNPNGESVTFGNGDNIPETPVNGDPNVNTQGNQ